MRMEFHPKGAFFIAPKYEVFNNKMEEKIMLEKINQAQKELTLLSAALVSI